MSKNPVISTTNALRAINAIALTIAIYRCVKEPALATSPMSATFWLANPIIDVVVLSMSEVGLLNKRTYYQLLDDDSSLKEPVDQSHFAMAYNALNLSRCAYGFFSLPNLSPELTTSTALSTLNIAYHALK